MTRFRCGIILLALLTPLLAGVPARGQDAEAPPQPSATNAPPNAPQEVSIGVGFSGVFGVGDVVRPGDWAGILLVINDTHDQPRNLAVRVSMPDPDGDTIERQRVIASTPGRDQSVWMYVRLPFSFTQGSLLTVSVHEVQGEAAGARTEIGRTLSWTRVQAREVVDAEDALIGVIGRGQYGLDQYENATGRGNSIRTSHEMIQIVSGIAPATMPDQWLGLMPYETLVWSDPPPRELGESPNDPRPRALRQWVEGGGHLVVLLPTIGETWFAPNNPLADLLPAVTPERLEGVEYEPYRRLLTDRESDGLPLPGQQVIHVFEPVAAAAPEDAMPIINGPDGPVVVRKLVGTGMVTVVGVDLTDPRLARGMLAADSFWHRILGKRFDLLTKEESDEARSSMTLNTQRVFVDGYIEPGIRMSGTAAAGVLLGLVVFALYWVLAGPGGFGVLKLRGLTRHSWLAFVAMVGLFAAVTWIGSRAARPTNREARHVTYIDHVFGQDVQRARVWATVMLPTYDDQRVAVTPSEESPDRTLAIAPFSGPSRTDALTSFPDARGYVVDVRHPEEVIVPARSTSKTFQIDWIGVSRTRGWSMPTPAIDDPPRVEGGRLLGSLTHGLPGPMRDVRIVLVQRQTTPRELWEARKDKVENPMPFVAYDWALRADLEWKPGELFDLNRSINPEESGAGGAKPFDNAVRGGSESPSRVDSQASLHHYFAAIYPMIQQPQYRTTRERFGLTTVRPLRRMTHGLDLAEWFTQPCLIIIGEIDNEPSPVPIYAGAPGSTREVPTTGRTVVRWVYPLTPNPPVFSEINR